MVVNSMYMQSMENMQGKSYRVMSSLSKLFQEMNFLKKEKTNFNKISVVTYMHHYIY